jgi:acyl carrier protein
MPQWRARIRPRPAAWARKVDSNIVPGNMGPRETDEAELLRRFIVDQLIRNPGVKVDYDTSLLKSGLIDSMSLADLALFIEEDLHVNVPDYGIVPENMDTIRGMLNYIAELRQG